MKKTAQKLLVGTVGAAGVLLASSTAANADSTTTHKVKQNETVWALSKKYGVSIQSIEKLNRINSNHLIITGQTLQIPSKDGSQTVNKNDNKSTYTIKSGDTLWRIAQNNHISLDELLSLNNLNASDIIYPGQVIKLTSAAATSTSNTQQQVQDKAATATPATDNQSSQAQATSASSSSQAVSTAQSSSAATTAASSSVTTPATSQAATTSSSSSVTQQPAANSSSAVQQSSSQVTTQSSSEVKDDNAQKVQYTAKAGDSLYSIAQSFGVSIDFLRSNNNLGATLLPGQTLTIVNPTKTPSQEESSSSNSVATNNTAATNSVAQSSSQQSVANNSVAQTSSSQQQTVTTPAASSSSTASSSSVAQTNNTQQATTTNTGSASASAIISYAQSFIGVPYVWGGSTPSGFDCSGLVQYVYAHYGVNLPRVTTAQENAGTVIPVSAAQPGDLYFWGAKGSSYHVAIATGGGSFIHAPEPGESVKVGSTQYFQPSFAVRVLQ
ncbi:LysM peptidoglycan-binding domain-containing protein [Ligilactobacillus salivarius]|uniref:C40 family peptidase n=1 Tax=Ligilactobacillus salivarius TaxID=1624 RepID=UPI000E496269|nr:C40 family peptidase [Ligilactobacillus salivarius]RHJ57462.1 LysM peptidoglycan-binding domain-containing protein [Ligilactobacillus salivarius]